MSNWIKNFIKQISSNQHSKENELSRKLLRSLLLGSKKLNAKRITLKIYYI